MPLAAGAERTVCFAERSRQPMSVQAIHAGSGNKSLRYEILTVQLQAASRTSPSGGAGSFGSLTGVPGDNTALAAALAAKLDAAGGTMTGALTINAGTLATAAFTHQQTWNSGGTTCRGMEVKITDTASASASTLLRLCAGGAGTTEMCVVDKSGNVYLNGDSKPTIWRRTDVDMLMFQGANTQNSVGVGYSSGLSGFSLASLCSIRFTNDTPAASPDIYLHRVAGSVLGLKSSSATTGASLELHEMTAPSSPSSNRARIYAEDNGSGKTRLMVLFPSGVAQQIAIEP